MIDWSDYLIRELALRRCIIVIGSGISKNSKSPTGQRPQTWEEFLVDANKKVKSRNIKGDVKKLLESKDYLTACEVIKNAMGLNPFNDFMMEQFHAPGFVPDDINGLIFKLDARIIVTPNFDNIYDRYALTESKGTVLIKKYTDDDIAQQIRNNKSLIIKMHGTIDDPNHVIFTRADYAKARNRNRDFYMIMDALAITNTFLFLGCGSDDPDIRLMLEDYCYKFKFGREHFFVLPKNKNPKSVNNILESTMNLKVVEYDSAGNHVILKESIKKLVDLVDQKRTELIDSKIIF